MWISPTVLNSKKMPIRTALMHLPLKYILFYLYRLYSLRFKIHVFRLYSDFSRYIPFVMPLNSLYVHIQNKVNVSRKPRMTSILKWRGYKIVFAQDNAFYYELLFVLSCLWLYELSQIVACTEY